MNTPLALRLVACGLPVPTFTPGKDGGCASWITSGEGADARYWEADLSTGDTCRPFGTDPAAGLLFRCVTTDTGLQLLPVLDDFALLGWVTTKLRALYGPHSGVVPNPNEPPIAVWGVYDDDGNLICDAPTELEALTVAWEAALKVAE